MTNTTLAFRSEWRWLLDRYSGFTLIDASADWMRGEWFVATVALLGVRVTLTRYAVVDLSPWSAAIGGAIDGYMEKAP